MGQWNDDDTHGVRSENGRQRTSNDDVDVANFPSRARQLPLDTLDGASVGGDDASSEAARRLRLVAEGSSDLLVLLDPSLRVMFINRATSGLSPQQLLGRAIDTIIPPRNSDRAMAALHRALQYGGKERFEIEWTGTTGANRYLDVRVAPVRENGVVVALALNGSDTTEHVLAQRAIATQAKMIESMLEGVALINAAGAIVITNPAFDRLFGYGRGMLIGQSLGTLAGGSPLDRGMESALSGQAGPWPLEFDARRKQGTVVSVAGALSRLDDSGRTHLLLVLQDVSERKQLESALLEAVNREQYRIGNDLHDGLGQELTGIALMLRCLSGRLAQEHPNGVADVDNITRLVSNAVEYTRSLARGLSPVNLERGGLCDAMSSLAMHARTIYGIKVALIDRLPPDAALDDEVANHLYRIAQEAVTNAVKHGQAKAVRLQLSAVRGKVRLVVADDGCGLPPNFGTLEGKQTGMGLRIMRYRARIARGEVRLERGERVGTRVVCECPLQTRTVSRATSTRVRLHRAAAKQGAAAVKRGAPLRKSKAKSTGV